MTTPHVHAELIKRWADDPSIAVWCWSDHLVQWFRDESSTWYFKFRYAIGEKPTEPPQRMCELAGVRFPEPLIKAPEHGTWVYLATAALGAEGVRALQWGGNETANDWLGVGLLHLTHEAAEQHSRALATATEHAIEAAK